MKITMEIIQNIISKVVGLSDDDKKNLLKRSNYIFDHFLVIFWVLLDPIPHQIQGFLNSNDDFKVLYVPFQNSYTLLLIPTKTDCVCVREERD